MKTIEWSKLTDNELFEILEQAPLCAGEWFFNEEPRWAQRRTPGGRFRVVAAVDSTERDGTIIWYCEIEGEKAVGAYSTMELAMAAADQDLRARGYRLATS